MRISVVGPVYPYRGGIAHHTAQLVQAMSSAGHVVHTISFKRQYPSWLYPGVSDRDPSSSSLRVEADYILDPIYAWTWSQANRLITQQNPDLVVIQWWTTFWGPAYTWLSAALKRKRVPVVYLIHNVYPHETRFFDRGLARMALNQGFAYVAQTNREKERLLALLPGRRVELCTLPVYSFLASSRISRAEARRKLNLDQRVPVVLFFGIVRPYKGLKVLIEALEKLGVEDQNPTLLVAGEIWENKEDYLRLIRHLGLEERIRLEDRYVPDEEAAVMFSAADMLVAPYLDGTQSAAVGVGLGFGLPMVVTDLVAAGVALEKQGNILVVPSGDAGALAEAIRMILSQTTEIKPMDQAEDDWWRLVSTIERLVEI